MQIQSELQKVYEIPECSICLQSLSDNLCNLQCGHVFHYDCIARNLQYRPRCPNCREGTIRIRKFLYPLTCNIKIDTIFKDLKHKVQNQKENNMKLTGNIEKLTQNQQTLQKQLKDKAQQFKSYQSKNNNKINNLNKQIQRLKAKVVQFQKKEQQNQNKQNLLKKFIEMQKEHKLKNKNKNVRVSSCRLRQQISIQKQVQNLTEKQPQQRLRIRKVQNMKSQKQNNSIMFNQQIYKNKSSLLQQNLYTELKLKKQNKNKFGKNQSYKL